MINLQPQGSGCKPYQVKQVRRILARYGLRWIMEHRYTTIISWSDEDQAFIVGVPELPGCWADGPTRHEALTNIQRVIQEWVATAKKEGRPVPAPAMIR